jgi:nucleoside phosphorylase
MDRALLTHDDYTVACICPMGVELAPVVAMLDERHQSLPTSRDQNSYTLGRMGVHNVVIAVMPEIGNNKAATVATQLLNDFKSIRFGLLVGIGGGIPGDDKDDIRLGEDAQGPLW